MSTLSPSASASAKRRPSRRTCCAKSAATLCIRDDSTTPRETDESARHSAEANFPQKEELRVILHEFIGSMAVTD